MHDDELLTKTFAIAFQNEYKAMYMDKAGDKKMTKEEVLEKLTENDVAIDKNGNFTCYYVGDKDDKRLSNNASISDSKKFEIFLTMEDVYKDLWIERYIFPNVNITISDQLNTIMDVVYNVLVNIDDISNYLYTNTIKLISKVDIKHEIKYKVNRGSTMSCVDGIAHSIIKTKIVIYNDVTGNYITLDYRDEYSLKDIENKISTHLNNDKNAVKAYLDTKDGVKIEI
jgi:hypothetical protein